MEGMEPILHTVQESELPVLKEWLEKFLPHSFTLYYTVREAITGRWPGTVFGTLGWPGILAVGEMEVSQDCPGYWYYSDPRITSVYSPSPDHLETLLTWPGFLDWSKPIIFQGLSKTSTPIIEKVARAKGGNHKVLNHVLHQASPSDLPPRPVPDGFYLHDLDPDLHTDYIMSTWIHSRTHSDTYIRELIKRFPSVGLFDKDDQCVGLEIGTEYGTVGMLHVREEYRGRGLGKVITSQLAQKFFCVGLPVMAIVSKDNESSQPMHTSCGFKEICDVDWVLFYHGDLMELMESVRHKSTD
ncbi:glycine N-acyltransferase [Elysia marginata]|uniref:Glycine N-acyltransferase-like protein n=1 Tax=Elysia marginata TaxID=1093978 RepID=A0AAV4EIP5_9GAST|nr:glycine N-acyltransferase [Elysia marginata]